MSKSDRAFRALARAQPDVVVGLLRAVVPSLIPPGAALAPDDVAPTHLDGLPPELDADWATLWRRTISSTWSAGGRAIDRRLHRCRDLPPLVRPGHLRGERHRRA